LLLGVLVGLERPNIGCLKALLSLLDVELDRLQPSYSDSMCGFALPPTAAQTEDPLGDLKGLGVGLRV
jgi:hypothetical protein